MVDAPVLTPVVVSFVKLSWGSIIITQAWPPAKGSAPVFVGYGRQEEAS